MIAAACAFADGGACIEVDEPPTVLRNKYRRNKSRRPKGKPEGSNQRSKSPSRMSTTSSKSTGTRSSYSSEESTTSRSSYDSYVTDADPFFMTDLDTVESNQDDVITADGYEPYFPKPRLPSNHSGSRPVPGAASLTLPKKPSASSSSTNKENETSNDPENMASATKSSTPPTSLPSISESFHYAAYSIDRAVSMTMNLIMPLPDNSHNHDDDDTGDTETVLEDTVEVERTSSYTNTITSNSPTRSYKSGDGQSDPGNTNSVFSKRRDSTLVSTSQHTSHSPTAGSPLSKKMPPDRRGPLLLWRKPSAWLRKSKDKLNQHECTITTVVRHTPERSASPSQTIHRIAQPSRQGNSAVKTKHMSKSTSKPPPATAAVQREGHRTRSTPIKGVAAGAAAKKFAATRSPSSYSMNPKTKMTSTPASSFLKSASSSSPPVATTKGSPAPKSPLRNQKLHKQKSWFGGLRKKPSSGGINQNCSSNNNNNRRSNKIVYQTLDDPSSMFGEDDCRFEADDDDDSLLNDSQEDLDDTRSSEEEDDESRYVTQGRQMMQNGGHVIVMQTVEEPSYIDCS